MPVRAVLHCYAYHDYHAYVRTEVVGHRNSWERYTSPVKTQLTETSVSAADLCKHSVALCAGNQKLH